MGNGPTLPINRIVPIYPTLAWQGLSRQFPGSLWIDRPFSINKPQPIHFAESRRIAPRGFSTGALHGYFAAVVFFPCRANPPQGARPPAMIFDFDRLRARIAARSVAPRRLEDNQRDVYDSHRHRIFSVSFYMTGNEMAAEEILRDTFIRAFTQADEPDAELVDAALVEQLQEHVTLEDENIPVPSVGFLPGGQNILRTDLEEAIRCLPPVERLIFLLMDVEGYSAGRVADLLRKTPGEVLRGAMTARLRLRAEIAARRRGETDCAQAA